MSKKKITTNIFWLLVEHTARLFLGLLITSMLASQLGVEKYGAFQYSLGLVIVFSSVSLICGAEVLVPQLAKASSKEIGFIVFNAFILRLSFSIFGYLLLFISTLWMQDDNSIFITLILGGFILLNEPFGVVIAWLQSQTKIYPKSFLYIMIMMMKCATVAFFVFFLDIKSPILFAIIWLAEAILMSFGLCFIYKKFAGGVNFQFDYNFSLNLLKKGLPFFLGLIVMSLFLKLDILMLGKLETDRALGSYSAAMQVFLSLMAVAPILAMSLAPIMVYQKSDIQQIKLNVLLICLIMSLVAIVLMLFIRLASPSFILFLFGSEFHESIGLLIDLSWVSCLFFINEALNIYLVKMGSNKQIIGKWLIVLFISIPIYYFCISSMGVGGVVIGYGFGYFVSCALGVYFMFAGGKT